MSFSVSFAGHSSGPHNEKVQEAVDAAVAILNSIPGVSGSVGGYSWENDSDKVTFDIFLKPEPNGDIVL